MFRLLIISAVFTCFSVAICDRTALAQGDEEGNNCFRQIAFCVESCGKLEQSAVAACSERCQRDVPCPTEGEPQTDLPKSKLPDSDLPSSSMPDSRLPTK
jgi:hypothetical protein